MVVPSFGTVLLDCVRKKFNVLGQCYYLFPLFGTPLLEVFAIYIVVPWMGRSYLIFLQFTESVPYFGTALLDIIAFFRWLSHVLGQSYLITIWDNWRQVLWNVAFKMFVVPCSKGTTRGKCSKMQDTLKPAPSRYF